MKDKVLNCAVLIALVIVASVEGQRFLSATAAAQTPATRAGGLPMFQVDPSWPKVPSKWKLGDASSIGIDAQDHVWVLHRPRTLPADQAAMAAPPVMVFDAEGNFNRPGAGREAATNGRRGSTAYISTIKASCGLAETIVPREPCPGSKPAGDDQLLKFTQAGKFVMQIGHSSKSTGNADTQNLHQPADAFVYRKTNEVFVADGYGNHRVAVFDADTGAFKRMWGAFGNKPADLDQCPPPSLTAVPDGPGPQQFSIVHAIRVSDDGLVYVADRENRRVQVFTIDGKFVKQLVKGDVPFARDLAFSPDPQQQFLYVGGARKSTCSTASRSRLWSQSKARTCWAVATKWPPIRKATSTRLRPPADSRSWRLKEYRRHRADELWGCLFFCALERHDDSNAEPCG